jgi:hypothetical protein
MRSFVHYIPILTTVVAVLFAWVIYERHRNVRSGPHLAWWAAGVLLYGVGTFTESSVTLFGWNPVIFKVWYISGALLGGAPLAQGTVYLLLKRKTANVLTAVLVPLIVVAAIAVVFSPIDYSAVETHRLSGTAMGWQWVRLFSPFINTYAFIFLVGGAVLSAFRYWKQRDSAHRVRGNALIAIGALLPGIGGMATRLGHTEVLYVMELIGLSLIWLGYREIVRGPRTANAAQPAASPSWQT